MKYAVIRDRTPMSIGPHPDLMRRLRAHADKLVEVAQTSPDIGEQTRCAIRAADLRKAAEALERIKALEAERDAAKEEAADARSTLSAWFDLATKTEEAVTPILLDGLKGYLRTSKSGGMPADRADAAYDVLEDFCRLYVGRELVPVLRGLAASKPGEGS